MFDYKIVINLMLKKPLFILVLSILFTNAFGQSPCILSIQGKVTQQSNQENIPGAVVYLSGTKFYNQSKAKGEFTINQNFPGNYTIVCVI